MSDIHSIRAGFYYLDLVLFFIIQLNAMPGAQPFLIGTVTDGNMNDENIPQYMGFTLTKLVNLNESS